MNHFYSIIEHTPFTKTEQKIVNYILDGSIRIPAPVHRRTGQTDRQFGAPTISRFARHCGYADFKELKAAVSTAQEEHQSPAVKLSASMERPDTSTLEGMLHYQQYCIEKTLSFLDQQVLDQAIDVILHARRIYLYAKGAALSMAQLLKFRLCRFGLDVTILPPGSSELFEEINFLCSEDLLILFGFQKLPREARGSFGLSPDSRLPNSFVHQPNL